MLYRHLRIIIFINMSLKLESILNKFIQSSLDIQIIPIHNHSDTPLTCVLDASFNPPHLAHAKLVKLALEHYAHIGSQAISILFLLATNNADKSAQDITSLARRLDMMQLLAQDILDSSPLQSISLGITKHARFVDKLHALNSLNHGTTYTFLIGFDTLVRILDPKYYDPNIPLAQSLLPLMDNASFLVLSRRPDSVSNTPQAMDADIDNQVRFVDQLRRGNIPGLPASWADKIHVIEATADTDQVSSSAARKLSSQGESTNAIVSDRIAAYIKEYKLYQ